MQEILIRLASLHYCVPGLSGSAVCLLHQKFVQNEPLPQNERSGPPGCFGVTMGLVGLGSASGWEGWSYCVVSPLEGVGCLELDVKRRMGFLWFASQGGESDGTR
jgi:hypothetical protein